MDSSSTTVVPKKCGVQIKPPALILVYKDEVKSKLKKRVMPVRTLNTSSNVVWVANELRFRHGDILEKVPLTLLEKLLSILQETMKGQSLEDALKTVRPTFSVDPEQDLNTVTEVELRRKKELMDNTFVKTQVKPDDPDFVYDKQVEFEQEDQVESGWDEEEKEDDDFWG